MAGNPPNNNLKEHEYLALYEALAANAKGRLFLAELLNRARPQDTRILFEAVGKIESALSVIQERLNPRQMAEELNRIAVVMQEVVANAHTHQPNLRNPTSEAIEPQGIAALTQASAELGLIADALDSRPIHQPRPLPLSSFRSLPANRDVLADDLELLD